ncbi:hypothetical protein BKA66DRAFT_444252 [Pyrenochaeta sp. MPI-SDFR-AT-0127]|nr:hypothetical protein BKA66DRAFT_444252 [Pyrenochaeta sp. MPI-SDFR-AT-0127]
MLSICSFAITALLSIVARGSRVPFMKEVVADLQTRTDHATAVGMIWTGPVSKGGLDITLTGDAESIMNQIIALNPDYAPEDSAMALGLFNGTTASTEGVLNKRETYSCHGLEAALTWAIDILEHLSARRLVPSPLCLVTTPLYIFTTLEPDAHAQTTLSLGTCIIQESAFGWDWLDVGKVVMNAQPITLMAPSPTMALKTVRVSGR